MMRKIHRVALAAFLKPATQALEPRFSLVSAAWARAFGSERRFTFFAPWKGRTEARLLAQERFRLRIDDLWKSSPQAYRGSFRFATASSRYIEQLALIRGLNGKEREDRALELLQKCTAEEKGTSDAQALAEVTPAAQLALQAITDAAVPAFRLAEELASAAK